jgi:hypothetical protein
MIALKPLAAALTLAAVVVSAVSIYAVTLFPISTTDNPSWYWLPRIASLVVLVAGLAFVVRGAKWPSWLALVISIPIVLAVFAGDLFVSVMYSCAHHRCI